MNRLLYVCLDGLGDEPLPELDGRTPLEAARTPLLDRLAAEGSQGLVHTVGPDIAPESDIAVFAILGYDPRDEHPGRGVLEVAGSNMPFRDGDLAFRVNFATADGTRIVDRRVGRDLPSEDAEALAGEVNEHLSLPDADVDLRATVGHRGAVVIHSRSGPLSAQVTNTDPAYAKVGTLGVALEKFEDEVATSEPIEDTPEA
ncbi:MAG: phosphoglycerate mutase, partial [Actinomycetota bacterium]|nr:phosphoglycerate mutase [Actinomycetota bacterium]